MVTTELTELDARVVAAKHGDLEAYSKATHDLEFQPYQPTWAVALEELDRVVIVCPPDTYKALDLETPIPTPQGWRRFGDLRPGDLVFDEKGKPCRVVGQSPVWEDRPCYRVEFSDGTHIVADAEHLWLTRTRADLDAVIQDARSDRRMVAATVAGSRHFNLGRTRRPERGSTAKTTEEIARTLRIPVSWREGWNHHICLPEPVEYPHKSLPIPPYTLGAWLGDGHSAGGRVTNADPEVWDNIQADGYELSSPPGITKNVYGLFPDLRKLGLLGNKHIPRDYLESSSDDRLALLQGLLDTDGAVGQGSVVFVNTNYNLVLGVLELARSLGFPASIHEYEARLNGSYIGPSWHITFPTDRKVFRLERKQQLLNKPRTPRYGKPIIGAYLVPNRPVRCIKVDNPTGLFLAGEGFTVTHNSTTVRLFVERLIGQNPNIRVLWLMGTGEQAVKQVMAVASTIKGNLVYKRAFGVKQDTEAQWTKNVLFVDRTRFGPDPTLMATGLQGPYQGLHFDVIVIDDPTTPQDVRSPTEMEAQKHMVRGMILDRLVEGGRIIVLLTRWGENDLVDTFADMGFTIITMPVMGDYPWGPTLSPHRFTEAKVAQLQRDKGDVLFCLAPETLVLKTDLTWVPIEGLQEGDELIGIDEWPEGGGIPRKMCRSVVQATSRLVLPCYRIVLADGRVIVASGEHPWLRANRLFSPGLKNCNDHSKDWVRTEDLAVGNQIRSLGLPWQVDYSWEAGWLAGFLDGEGYVSNTTIGFSQNEGAALEAALDISDSLGFPFRLARDSAPCKALEAALDISEKSGLLWDGRAPPKGRKGYTDSVATVISVEPIGSQEVVGIQTSTRTFVAEGLFTHNSLTYMCDASAIEGNAVKREHILYWDAKTLPEAPMNLYMGIDPAASTRAMSDYRTIATVGIDLKTRKKYLLEMFATRMEIPDFRIEILKRAKRMAGLRAIGLETTGFQLSLMQDLKRMHQLPMVEIPYRTRRQVMHRVCGIDRDKFSRALYLDALFTSQRLYIPKDLPLLEGVSLESELCSVPNGKHDDRMDALAFACALADSAVRPKMALKMTGW